MKFILPLVALTASTVLLVAASAPPAATTVPASLDPTDFSSVDIVLAAKHTATKKHTKATHTKKPKTKKPSTTTKTKPSTTTKTKPTPKAKPTSISNTVITNCRKAGTFAVTADDGPYVYGHAIAKTLEEHNSVGTFFVNGNNYACIYDYADELIARYKAGHQIALETALLKILGIKPAFFRPPYGSYNQPLVDTITSWGYQVVTWNFVSGDSVGVSANQSVANYKALLPQYPKPFMALNHETYAGTAQIVIPEVVPLLVAKGWKLVTVAQCLGMNPYQLVTTPGVRDSTWTCAGTPQPQNN